MKKKQARQSIKKDVIHPEDFLNMKLMYSCEDCSHFASEEQECSIGFWSRNHLRKSQLKNYNLSGQMALCRFMEID